MRLDRILERLRRLLANEPNVAALRGLTVSPQLSGLASSAQLRQDEVHRALAEALH